MGIMASQPQALAPLRKFFRRAEEMKKMGEHQVAYACEMYALQQGMGLMKAHPAEKAQISAIILPLFDNLEKQKATLDTRGEALRPAVQRVAIQEFDQADQADR